MRHTGPKCSLCRREGVKLFLKGTRCEGRKCPIENPQVKGQFTRRDMPPGKQNFRRRRKTSEYGNQLREKQRAKRYYGVQEAQFKRYFSDASRSLGNTGQELLSMLERRLDNVVCRLGWGTSHAQARQMVLHGHVQVNGKKVDRPSFLVRKNDTITIRGSEKSKRLVTRNLELVQDRQVPSWLRREDGEEKSALVIEKPTREQVGIVIQEAMIIELLAR